MIFLAGSHGAGKTESARFLTEIGFVSLDLGPTLRSIHQQSSSGLTFPAWIKQGESMHGKDFTEVLLAKELNKLRMTLKNKPLTDIVVVGSRGCTNVEYLESAVPKINGFRRTIIFIDAPFETLRQRFNACNSVNLSSDEFQKLLDSDIKLGLESLREIASVNLRNDGTLEELKHQLQKIIANIGYQKTVRTKNVSQRQ